VINKIIVFTLFCSFLIYGIFSLGSFMDAGQAPKKSDIIVSLGGDDGQRLRKAVELYTQGYSASALFIHTGQNRYTDERKKRAEALLLAENIQNSALVHIKIETARNTVTELLLIRDFMLKHGYKSVLFVSTPMHTRRIRILADQIAKYTDNGLEYTLTPSYEWKSTSAYLFSKEKREYVFLETLKLGYNLVKYNYPFLFFTRYYKRLHNGEWKKDIDMIKPLQ
jgi:hypothetical protein